MRTLQSEALDGKFLPIRETRRPKTFRVSGEILAIHEEMRRLMDKQQ